MCNYASAFTATTCGCFTSNDQIICRKAGSCHTKTLKEPPLFHFCCIARPEKAENSLWLKQFKVMSCEKVTSLAWSPLLFYYVFFSTCSRATVCFLRRLSLIKTKTAACHFKLLLEDNKSRAEARTLPITQHRLLGLENHKPSCFHLQPYRCVTAPGSRVRAGADGARARAHTSVADAFLVSALKAAVCCFSPGCLQLGWPGEFDFLAALQQE